MNEIGLLVYGASTESNSWGLNTVLPTTSKRLTVIFSGTLPGIGAGGVGVCGGVNNSSGGGSGSDICGSGSVGSAGGRMS